MRTLFGYTLLSAIAYFTSQLRKLMKEHLERIKQDVFRKTQLERIQQMQIADFIYLHCIKQHYSRDKYVKLEPNQIYFVVFDLVKIGLIVDLTDMKWSESHFVYNQ